ncbi:MAG TPA: DUF1569 domain-containing protein [Cyclobacteriaceae bacterium]|nr:DUF1569 domain-containing protein [Cyclobacteriaceae bacterium]
MRKNLLDSLVAQEIIDRAQKLTPDANNLWGKMNVTEMLYHCNMANNFIFEDKVIYKRPTFKQRLLKFICFKVLVRLPRNNKQPVRINSKGKVKETEFIHHRNLFIETIDKFPKQNQTITSMHPRLGYLTNQEWGIIAWMHMDHHLRQFGV